MNADPAYAEITGVYDFDREEIVPLDKCVERGLMTKEEYDECVRVNSINHPF